MLSLIIAAALAQPMHEIVFRDEGARLGPAKFVNCSGTGVTCTRADNVVTISASSTSTDVACSGCVSDPELASNYSGVGACPVGQCVQTLNDNAPPACVVCSSGYTLPVATASALGGIKGNGTTTVCSGVAKMKGWDPTTGAMTCEDAADAAFVLQTVIVGADPVALFPITVPSPFPSTLLSGLHIVRVVTSSDVDAALTVVWTQSTAANIVITDITGLVSGVTYDLTFVALVGDPVTVSGGAGYTVVQDEGAALARRPTVNFVGPAVGASDDAVNNRTNVTVLASGVGSCSAGTYPSTLNDGAAPTCTTFPATTHALLSATHTDTTAAGPVDDTVVVGSGTAWTAKAVPHCYSNTTHLSYDATSNAFFCPVNYVNGGSCAAGNYATSVSVSGAPSCSQVQTSQLGGTVTDAQLASNYSGVGACAAGSVVSVLNDNGAPTCVSNSAAVGGTCAVGDVVTAISTTGAPTCAKPITGGTCAAGEFIKSISATGAITCGAPQITGGTCAAGSYISAVDNRGAITCASTCPSGCI